MQQPFRVLLVEDQPTDQLLIEETLADLAFMEVELAWERRLEGALGRLDGESFDIVLLDLGLPDSQGIATFDTMHARHPDVPVVVLTGLDDEAVGNRLVQEGAQDYLVKSQLDGTILGRAIRYAVERRHAARALEEADRRKSEFLAMLGHELRNPLAPIATAAELMGLVGSADPRLEHARAVIGRQVRHMARLIDDLLDVSRITLGKIALQRSAVDMRAVVEVAVEQLEPAIARAGHELTVELPGERLEVEGDATRLAQVIGNLLANASWYTPSGGRITVRAAREGSMARVEVEDNGRGMSAELIGRVFELFVQGEQGLDRKHGGLGIGLTLARGLVELHGGSIEAHSEGLGKGSRFVVRIPVRSSQERGESAGAAPGPASEVGRAVRERQPMEPDTIERLPHPAILLSSEGVYVGASRSTADLLGFELTDLGSLEARLERAAPWPWERVARHEPIDRAQVWRDRETGRELRIEVASLELAGGPIVLLLGAVPGPLRDLHRILAPVTERALARSHELSLRAVLRHLVEEACELIGAKYGALGVLVADRAGLRDFVAVGISDEEARRVGPLPVGRGLLGAVIAEGSTIRVDDIGRDPRRSGFPPHHPPMTSFLGVPLRVGGEVFGNFYLCDRRDGRPFTDEDVRLLERFSGQAALTVAYARQVEESQARTLDIVLENTPAAIVFFPADVHQTPYGNRAAVRLLGTLARGDDPVRSYDLALPDGRMLALDELPSIRALAGEIVINLEVQVISRATGAATPALVSTAPVAEGERLLGAIVVFQDITPLKELEELRSELATIVAHDLRSPLQTVMLHLDTLLMRATGEEARVPTTVLRGMRRSGQRIAKLVDDLLDASRAEAGGLRVERQATDVPALVKALLEQRQEDHLELDVRGQPPRACADPARLEQIVANLLDNAFKHSPPGSPVRVSVEAARGGVEIAVEDRGHGIAPEDLPRIFERYYQAKREGRQRGTVGLGLFIVKALVDAHRGSIDVESTVGTCTIFRVWLPAA